jgi:hypothetical protein
MYADKAEKAKDLPPAPKNAAVIRWSQLYDIIGSGYRQRFTVLEKGDLFSWVSS